MTDTKPAGEVKSKVSTEEARLAFAAPAPFVNKFYIHTTAIGMIRLTFSELNSDLNQPNVRSAIMMHVQDAMAFRDLLTNMLAPLEEHIREAQAMAGEKDG